MYYFKWPLLQSVLTEINLTMDYDVLIEHDIPLLYITKSFNQYYLHYLIDEDDDLKKRRYLYLPISTMKIRALVTNGISLLNCLESDNLLIYDLDLEDNILLKARIEYNDIDIDALPKNNITLPPLSEAIIEKLYGHKNNDKLVFILEGEKVNNHSIPFTELSSYLSKTQQMVIDSSSFYCEENGIIKPINAELNVIATQVASFAINTHTMDEDVLNAIQEIIPKYTKEFINFNKEEIYNILDTLPTKLSQSLFSYYKFILKNNYESIIKVKDTSLYLNKDFAKKIKMNINNAEYIRKESITATGYLLGANIKTNSFYFENIKDLTTIKGHFSKDYINTHTSTLILSDKQLWEAKFQLSIEYKFSEFKKTYELLELVQVNSK